MWYLFQTDSITHAGLFNQQHRFCYTKALKPFRSAFSLVLALATLFRIALSADCERMNPVS